MVGTGGSMQMEDGRTPIHHPGGGPPGGEVRGDGGRGSWVDRVAKERQEEKKKKKKEKREGKCEGMCN